MPRPQALLCLASAALATALVELPARAAERSTIRLFGDHPRYVFEAEPHLVVGWGGPFFPNGVPGVGFRGTFHVADGFVKSIDDSVGVGFGVDVTTSGRVVVPVVLQWNFWLSTHWSVFGEPGLAIGGGGPGGATVGPAFFAGGRFHFTDRVALTLRVGYPELSVGVSFLL